MRGPAMAYLRSLQGLRQAVPYLRRENGISSAMSSCRSFQLAAKHVLPSKFRAGESALSCAVSDLLRSETENAGNDEKAVHRHVVKNGKLLVRARISKLIDEGTEFMELSAHAGFKLYKGETVSAAGVLTGVGIINGVRCMLIANDATVKGGTIYPIGLKKQLRAQEVAIENHLPCVYLVDSGGAFLPMQDEIFNPGGRVFYNEAIMNAMDLPSLAVICGSCTAGAAYVPAMADEAIIVDKIGTVFLAGPPLVYAATGEKVSAEQLGGARVHSTESGLCDAFATNEEEAIEMAREAVPLMNFKDQVTPIWTRASEFEEPLYSATDLGSICASNRNPGTESAGDVYDIDMSEVIARLVDGSRFKEFKPDYGSSLLCGWAQLEGHPIAIVANATTTMCANGARKSAQFIQIASKRRIPILFLHHISEVEEGGLREGSGTVESAAMIHAIACSKIPKVSLVVGDSIGPGNFAMCGRAMNPNLMFTWPNARVAMDGSREEAKLRGGVPNAMYGTSRLWDDGVRVCRKK
eukprot:INCI20158.1.p1 GENE.INCI20158.1~~INCI20158.1.p1  ORF type:complete len:524 (-),score=82.56 INCI20158.1:285-1856(-)